jgi:antitoxin ParD1/3/4
MQNDSLISSLPGPLRAFVVSQVSSGGYSASSDYIHALLDAQRRRKAEDELETLLLEGINSGPSIEVNDEYWAEKHRRIAAHRKAPSTE